MNLHSCGARCAIIAVALAAALLLMAAGFHKMTVEAYVESGAKIVGEARYHSTPVTGALVRALAPDGAKLAETKTDDAGAFSFTAKYRCDHRIEVNDGGHKGTITIPAGDLPASLPAYSPVK